jgi:hypothetical protein
VQTSVDFPKCQTRTPPFMESSWQIDPQALAAFLASFEGTPHMQRRRKAGRGVDCIQLVLGALEAAGATPHIILPSYSQECGFSRAGNSMVGAFAQCFHTSTIQKSEWQPQDGDIGLFAVGRYSNHCGIVSANRFWHVTVGRPVHHCSIASVMPRLQAVVRFTSPGIKSTNPANLQLT